MQQRFRTLKQAAGALGSGVDEVPEKVRQLEEDLGEARRQIAALRQEMASGIFARHLESVPLVSGVPVLTATLPNADADTLRQMADRFRQRYPSGVVVLGSSQAGRPLLVAAVTEDLVKRGLHAGEIAKAAAQLIGGSGGGRPNLAQAGGRDASKLQQALDQVPGLVEKGLKK